MPEARKPWPRERVARELEDFLAGRDVFPSYREFERCGRRTLRNHVDLHGGSRQWAQELGPAYHPKPGPRGWTEDRVRQELRSFLRGRSAWPSADEFRQQGQGPLRRAVRATGGAARWAHEFGLPTDGLPVPWTEERIEAALREFLRGRGEWPTRREFRAAGLGGLLRVAYERSGATAWALRMGVEHPRRRA